METNEPPSVKTRVFRFIILLVVGFVLGKWFIEPVSEPIAVSWLYPKIASAQEDYVVRFIDLHTLYEQEATDATEGRLPPKTFQKLLNAVEKLDKQHRPSAIGFDIPLFEEAVPGQLGGIRFPKDREEVLKLLIKFHERTKIPIRIGIRQFQFNSPSLLKLYPHLPNFLASTFVYPDATITPLIFGSGDTDDTLGVLGYAVATDYAKYNGGRIEPGRSALTTRHYVEAPKEWPSHLQSATWVYVDYSLLRHREELTIRPEGLNTDGTERTSFFSEKDLKQLKHKNGKETLWIVGLTQVPESEDLFVYDAKSRWVREGQPTRRIYQHGAIAHTYLYAPRLLMPEVGAIIIDVACSLLGLIAILLMDKRFTKWEKQVQTKPLARTLNGIFWGLGRVVLFLPWLTAKVLKGLSVRLRKGLQVSASQHAHKATGNKEVLQRLLVVPVIVLLPFLISYLLAVYFQTFWFGFVGSAIYALIEPIFDGTLEQL